MIQAFNIKRLAMSNNFSFEISTNWYHLVLIFFHSKDPQDVKTRSRIVMQHVLIVAHQQLNATVKNTADYVKLQVV